MGKNQIELRFLGAAGTVTGSRTLLSTDQAKVLIDCGLFQGPKAIRMRNWEAFEYRNAIEAIVLTHAHIDHSGFLPKLVKEGYRGPIFASRASVDLCRIMLLDAAHLQEEDARFANQSRHSHHEPALPLFDTQDAERALSLMKALDLREDHEILPGLKVKLVPSGHILGSTFVQTKVMNAGGDFTSILFSGDIGHNRSRVLKGPEAAPQSDYVVMEATYGDRAQPRQNPLDEMEAIVKRVIGRGGVLVVPAFTVGRTQELLNILGCLAQDGRIPKVPVYVDSPMALDATELYMRHSGELRDRNGFGPLACANFTAVRSTDDSMLLCMDTEPKIVISAAGMLTGGRILHHLKARLPDEKSAVLFVGYQAEGTKGRLLRHGLKKIRLHHQEVEVEAEILTMDSLSAHADSDELVEWAGQFRPAPRRIFLNHGETSALDALQYRLTNELRLDAEVVKTGEVYLLE